MEIRYPKAHKYWDVSGALIARVEEGLPALKCNGLGPNGFEFSGEPGCGVESCIFYWDRVVLNADMLAAHGRFEGIAVEFWEAVTGAFGIKRLSRVGNRYAYAFPTDTEEAATAVLTERAIWSLSESLASFGTAEVPGVALRTFLGASNTRIRLEIAAGEHGTRGGKSRPGVLLDIDFSLAECPSADAFNLAEILGWNWRFVRDHLHRVLR